MVCSIGKKMRSAKWLLFNLIAAFLGLAEPASASNTRNLLPVIVIGLHSDKGAVVMRLYDHPLRYRLGRPVDILTAQIENGEAIATFDLESIKQCVVVVFHDENSNNKLDKTLLRSPKEGIGLSNNKSSSQWPDYKALVVRPDGKPLIIYLKYR